MHPTRSRAVALLAACVAGALSGCESRDDYPKDRPAVDTRWFRSCPDLAGTDAIDDGVVPVVRTSYGASPPWERVVIAGRPGGDLRFTLMRTVKPVDDPAPWSPPHDALEQAQADMRGRARVRAAEAKLVPSEAAPWLPSSGYSGSHGRLTLRGGDVLARDTSHGLVGRGVHIRTTKQVDVWCVDGCQGIPLGFEVQHLWLRWERLEAALPAPTNKPSG